MRLEARNLLYERPELYELVYHGADHAVPRMCEALFERHLGRPPDSLLDVGCGTGRDLGYFATAIPNCVGVDLQEQMIAYARRQRPAVDFRIGDMRTFSVGRRFEAITCLGLVFCYLLPNADVAAAVATLARHSRPGTILVLEVINSIAGMAGERMPATFRIDVDGFRAEATAAYTVDRRHQLLTRRRVWRIHGRPDRQDLVRWRMLFPMEIEYYLTTHGFEVLGMHDNPALSPSDLTESSLFVTARYGGEGGQDAAP